MKDKKSLIETSNEERVKRVLKKENSTLEESLRAKIKEEIEQERTNTIVQDKAKEMIERQNSEKICRKLDTKDEIGKVNKGRKNKNNDSVVKVKVQVVNKKDKKCNSLKEKINERLKLIERTIVDSQNNSLTKLTKKIKILNTPFRDR